MTTVAILAGGLATRIRPLTARLPKSLIDIHGHPFIDYQLCMLKANGFLDVVLCIGYEGQQIMEHLGDGSRFGLSVRYSSDGDTLIGTGGALLKALPLLSDPFLVTYGDSYLRADYQAILAHFLEQKDSRQPAPLGLMTVFKNDGKFDKSNVVFESGNISTYDKTQVTPRMQHIDWGLGILTHSAFNGFSPDAHTDLAQIYSKLVANGRLLGYEVMERFYEIGSFDGLSHFTEIANDL